MNTNILPSLVSFAKPWIIAAGSAATSYFLLKKSSSDKRHLKEAQLELLEQQRTINRLRHELGSEKAKRESTEQKGEEAKTSNSLA